MNWSADFFNDAYFYATLIIGLVALYPRAQLIADKIAAGPGQERVKATLGQRLCVLIPTFALIYPMLILQRPLAGLVMIIAWIVGLAGMVMVLRGRGAP